MDDATKRELITAADMAGLRMEFLELLLDAERYRKWRADYTGEGGTDMLIALADAWAPEQVDAAIDAAPAVGAT